ncbi:MAG: orotate phosphoribosyltransferase [Gammaproteobacteria bacterium]|nr:MAG: orotate phosphoribosyltransferase [Gammaproteobacteria bacterium]
METYQEDFLNFAIERDVLKFGRFTLKSGRVSPYFFNSGNFHTGRDLSRLGDAYAKAIVNSAIEFDVLFGPAYKGIPLASAASICLSNGHQLDTPWCFNRKEKKVHGEGGVTVGSPLKGKVLIIDDVITAGTAIREAIDLIKVSGATPAGVVIALDRQEKGKADKSAIEEVEEEFGIPVISIIKLENIYQYLVQQQLDDDLIKQIQQYRLDYGILTLDK